MDRREAKKGAGDEIPRQVWAAAQRNPIAKRKSSEIGEEPSGDNYDSDKDTKEFLQYSQRFFHTILDSQ